MPIIQCLYDDFKILNDKNLQKVKNTALFIENFN